MELLEAIKSRKTAKVLGNPNSPIKEQLIPKSEIDDLIQLAAKAPFHYPCNPIHLKEGETTRAPWRLYCLDKKASLELLDFLNENNIETGKIAQLLAACQYLIQVTWCPEPSETEDLFEPNLKNMEHIAGTSAAIQNMLIGATGKGIQNYWSSGGKLRSETVFNYLNIPSNQILLGSLFFFPEQVENVQIVGGAHRDKEGTIDSWTTWK